MRDGEIPRDGEEVKEFQKILTLTHQIPVQRSHDDFRIQHNKEQHARNPPGSEIPRLEDLGVITDEMLDDLDRIFLSEYPHPHSHEFRHDTPECRASAAVTSASFDSKPKLTETTRLQNRALAEFNDSFPALQSCWLQFRLGAKSTQAVF
jgi:hypothetical protein